MELDLSTILNLNVGSIPLGSFEKALFVKGFKDNPREWVNLELRGSYWKKADLEKLIQALQGLASSLTP